MLCDSLLPFPRGNNTDRFEWNLVFPVEVNVHLKKLMVIEVFLCIVLSCVVTVFLNTSHTLKASVGALSSEVNTCLIA